MHKKNDVGEVLLCIFHIIKTSTKTLKHHFSIDVNDNIAQILEIVHALQWL